MEYRIRVMTYEEVDLLKMFLYEAFYVPQGSEPFSKDIINEDEHRMYYQDFYSNKSDMAFVAEKDEEIVGCVWVRVMNDYGHISEDYPSLSIAVLKDHQKQGIGSALMEVMINELKQRGYKGVSLSVQTENYASHLYQRLGFEVYQDNGDEWVMLLSLAESC